MYIHTHLYIYICIYIYIYIYTYIYIYIYKASFLVLNLDQLLRLPVGGRLADVYNLTYYNEI